MNRPDSPPLLISLGGRAVIELDFTLEDAAGHDRGMRGKMDFATADLYELTYEAFRGPVIFSMGGADCSGIFPTSIGMSSFKNWCESITSLRWCLVIAGSGAPKKGRRSDRPGTLCPGGAHPPSRAPVSGRTQARGAMATAEEPPLGRTAPRPRGVADRGPARLPSHVAGTAPVDSIRLLLPPGRCPHCTSMPDTAAPRPRASKVAGRPPRGRRPV